jgi:predicted nucleic acid-binding protein
MVPSIGIAYNTMMADGPVVVLDTNVLEAALRSRRGASFRVLSLVGTGRFKIAVSVPLVFEYEDVLMRQAGARGRDPTAVTNLLDYLCAVGRQQAIFFLWRPCLPDPRDDLVLELAVAAGCEAIVTHNGRHFAPAGQFGIRVCSPGKSLQQIGAIP